MKTKYPCPEGFDPRKWARKTEREKEAWYRMTGYKPPVSQKANTQKTKGGDK